MRRPGEKPGSRAALGVCPLLSGSGFPLALLSESPLGCDSVGPLDCVLSFQKTRTEEFPKPPAW